MAVKIKECVCKSDFQDKEYGKQMRVMNFVAKSAIATRKEYRCSVCERVH